jgi:hypothetical protein
LCGNSVATLGVEPQRSWLPRSEPSDVQCGEKRELAAGDAWSSVSQEESIMKAVLRISWADGSSSDVVVRDGEWADGEIIHDGSTGLCFELCEHGVWLLDSADYPPELKVPACVLPAIWNRVEDEPVRRLFAELRRCGRNARYWLEWGQWLLNDGKWETVQFIVDRSK